MKRSLIKATVSCEKSLLMIASPCFGCDQGWQLAHDGYEMGDILKVAKDGHKHLQALVGVTLPHRPHTSIVESCVSA